MTKHSESHYPGNPCTARCVAHPDYRGKIGYQDQPNHERWYVSDLPGHIGTAKAVTEAGRKADWGFSTKLEQAIALSPYWQRRFLAYYRGIPNRHTGLLDVNPFGG